MSGATTVSQAREVRARFLGWYRVFCLVFGVFLVLYAGARVGMLRAGHRAAAEQTFLTLRAGARTAMAAFDARDDKFFSSTLGELARGAEELRLLAVYEKGGKVYYFYASSADVFVSPPEPTTDMTSVPVYRQGPLGTIRLEGTLEQAGVGRLVTVEALFRILTPADLHRVGTEIVFILLIFLFVTATVLVVSAALSPRPSAMRGWAPAPEGRPAASPTPTMHVVPPHAPRREPEPPTTVMTEPAAHAPVTEPMVPGAAAPVEAVSPEPTATPAAEPLPSPAPPPAAEKPAPRSSAAQGLPPRRSSMYNDETGLVYRDFLEARLRSEIDRAAASDQDVVLAVVAVDGPEGAASPPVTAAIAQRIRETFPYRDLAFEYNAGFAVIIPDINLDRAMQRMEDFRAAVAAAPIEGQSVTVSIGIGARNGRIIGDEVLLREATQSLAKAIRDGRNQVVAFRADPDKFRRVLAT